MKHFTLMMIASLIAVSVYASSIDRSTCTGPDCRVITDLARR